MTKSTHAHINDIGIQTVLELSVLQIDSLLMTSDVTYATGLHSCICNLKDIITLICEFIFTVTQLFITLKSLPNFLPTKNIIADDFCRAW